MVRIKANYIRPNGIEGSITTLVTDIIKLEEEVLDELCFCTMHHPSEFKITGFEVIEHVGTGSRQWTFRNNV